MSDLETLEEIKKIISDQFSIPKETIEESSFLEEDLGIGELEMEDLIIQIQSKFDIQIPQEKLGAFKTVSDLASYVYENVENTG